MNRFTTVITVILLWSWQAPLLFAQEIEFIRYKLEPASRLWLEGTATVGDFRCKAVSIDGTGKLPALSAQKYLSSDSAQVSNEVHVSILVKSFECGNSAMNNDMYDAMKADSFPSITYELITAAVLGSSQIIDSTRKVTATGKLTIAGVSKIVSMTITVRQISAKRFQITGSKTLSMHDFDITPPSAMFGLIKANEQLIVRFNLIAKAERE